MSTFEILRLNYLCLGFPRSSDGKESACDAGDPCSIPGSGRSPGEGNGTPSQYYYLENPMDRGAWQATPHCVAKTHTHTHTRYFQIGSLLLFLRHWVFPGGAEVKASTNAGDLGSIPGSGRSPGEVNGNPHQYPCLENPMEEGAWRAIVHGVTKSRTWLSDFTFTNGSK